MKNKFFTHRFLPILSVFLFVAFVLTSIVFASSDLSANNGNTYTLPDFTDEMKQYPNYLIFVENGGSKFNLYFLIDDDGYFYNDSSGVYHYGRAFLCSTTGNGYYNSRTQGTSTSVCKIGGAIGSSSIFISSVDIYKDVNKNEIFFQKPPQVIPEVLGITETLVEETEKVQIAEQLKIMIVGFLKYLIVLVISLIAFWKGWQFLSMQLRKA